MLKILKQSFTRGVVTNSFPEIVAEPPDGFRGKPVIDFAKCTACDQCAAVCPTNAIRIHTSQDDPSIPASEKHLSLSYGDCIFCGECAAACPDSIRMSKEFLLATAHKESLTLRARYVSHEEGYQFAGMMEPGQPEPKAIDDLGQELRNTISKVLGRSLHIREVDAGSCNGCEIEITALNNAIYDIERFGVHFVASPRHADMLLVTGPVTRNMQIALKQTYEATPDPKLVVAVGSCAIGGGIFGRSYASCGGVDMVVPVDVYIPGCPPRPEALLHGILLAIKRLPEGLTSKSKAL
jgi:Ni,Fe-hydrogenase III small subunit/formate hydrogenlyase subunit 6/NADH:ubiquinone oxidoreductase subunit I